MEIVDKSTETEKYFSLVIDETEAASVKTLRGEVFLQWAIYGPQKLEDAKKIVEGLLHLTIIAESLRGK